MKRLLESCEWVGCLFVGILIFPLLGGLLKLALIMNS